MCVPSFIQIANRKSQIANRKCIHLFVCNRINLRSTRIRERFGAYAPLVQSSDLTAEQAEALRQRVAQMLRYTAALRRRMERLCFPHEDPLYRATVDSFYALQHLHIQAHYLTCNSGVGRQRMQQSHEISQLVAPDLSQWNHEARKEGWP